MKSIKTFVYLHHTELRTLSVVFLALLIAGGDAVFAQTTDPWANLSDLLITWITGNLGKFITLVGIIISITVALIMHSFKPLVYGIIMSVVIGGAVGIARMFFEAGSAAFGTSW
jgi:type IV secretory pathway VirB2 component (pilin)